MVPSHAFPYLPAILSTRLPVAFPAPEAACLALAFAMGATIGSFLNVVVHRAPRGRSVVSGRSRCPACGGAVRWYDNIPVLGWLLLRGRCRDCSGPIAARYPLVELAGGCLAALVAVATLQGGWDAGSREAGGSGPVIDQLLLHGDWRPVAFWLHRTLILMSVLAWALLAAEGHPVSGVTVLVTTLLAGLAAAIAPGLEPWAVDYLPGTHGHHGGLATAAEGRPQPLLAALLGAAAGWICGSLPDRRSVRGPFTRHAAMLVGAGCGWQAALMTTAVFYVCGRGCRGWPGTRRPADRSPPPDAS
jgi:prepilin signal peptidase PulO-like enzyme (type II secretory pathway)